jgi:hypothetical protein
MAPSKTPAPAALSAADLALQKKYELARRKKEEKAAKKAAAEASGGGEDLRTLQPTITSEPLNLKP